MRSGNNHSGIINPKARPPGRSRYCVGVGQTLSGHHTVHGPTPTQPAAGTEKLAAGTADSGITQWSVGRHQPEGRMIVVSWQFLRGKHEFHGHDTAPLSRELNLGETGTIRMGFTAQPAGLPVRRGRLI